MLHCEPLRQGDLDGLCGLYAVVNAARVLCPEIDQEASRALFAWLVHALRASGVKPTFAVTTGIARVTLARLVKMAIGFAADEFHINLVARRWPANKRRLLRLGAFWRVLAHEVSPDCVAILGLEGRLAHWTVAVAVTTRRIRLCDSGRLGMLFRCQCTLGRARTRYVLSPQNVIFLGRATEVRGIGTAVRTQ